ncbi:MAG TPA: polysaccharide pyruvyl transferase family protein, partial [Dongiaceae bacterium]|nr:polysaccharide pyruvyl transferase family protein [Dongiaceae bacterium]
MLYYFQVRNGNFGDDLNPWLWSRLAPEVCADTKSILFLGIGTVMSRNVPVEPVKIVFGSGCNVGNLPVIDRKWNFYCVRGPLTAAKLNLPPEMAITDPAILLRRFAAPEEKKFSVSFMPHHQSTSHADWKNLCDRIGFHFIEPGGGVEKVLSEIGRTKLLITEALHGAIVADVLRVPWIPVRLYGNFAEFKWRDWTQSIGMPLKIQDVPPVFAKGEMIHAFKKSLASVGLGKEKWKRLPLRASSEREISGTLRTFETLAKTQTP